jgi:predicted metal-dependent hydrolase
MSHSANHLNELYAEAFRYLGKNRPAPEIEVKFYPYTGLHHTIRFRSGKVLVRLSDIIANAPHEVHRSLAFMLVAKILGRKVPFTHEKNYRDYVYSSDTQRTAELARRGRGKKIVSSPRGNIYNLDKIFKNLNYRYFEGELAKPTLTWSQRKTHRILGHHDSTHNTIVISKTLDSEDVPEWLVEFVLYHEMLHIKHPARIVNGRRQHHTKAFRSDEKKFPYYEQSQKWIEHLVREQRRLHD